MLLALNVGKFHGPLSIIAAVPLMNCVDTEGVWLQLRHSLEADPSFTREAYRFIAATPGAPSMLENVNLPPSPQKNGSHCHVVSSPASQVNPNP